MGCCYVCLKTRHGSSAIALLGAFNGISGVAMGLTVSLPMAGASRGTYSIATGWFWGRERGRFGGGGEEVEEGQGRAGKEQLRGYLSTFRIPKFLSTAAGMVDSSAFHREIHMCGRSAPLLSSPCSACCSALLCSSTLLGRAAHASRSSPALLPSQSPHKTYPDDFIPAERGK